MSAVLDALRDAIAAELRSFPEVAAAYLFGSVARGTARSDSDVDVGIVYRRGASAAVHDRVVAALGPVLLRVTGRERADLVDLAAQGPIFAHQVLCEGRRIYEADRDRRVDFESDVIARALDFRPTYEIATRGKAAALRRWLREQGLVGRPPSAS
jgi:predicted nucleotidyltransferase